MSVIAKGSPSHVLGLRAVYSFTFLIGKDAIETPDR